MAFTAEEVAYLRAQPLARLATVGPDGQPDVVPVGFDFDDDHIYIYGLDLTKSRKYRNVEAGHEKVALVVDDLASTDPWIPRFMRIYGTAEVAERDGRPCIRIAPTVSWSWNLAGRPFDPTGATGAGGPLRTTHRPA